MILVQMFHEMNSIQLRPALLQHGMMWRMEQRIDALAEKIQTNELTAVLGDVKSSLTQQISLSKEQTVSLHQCMVDSN
jgi:hypothetical protein